VTSDERHPGITAGKTNPLTDNAPPANVIPVSDDGFARPAAAVPPQSSATPWPQSPAPAPPEPGAAPGPGPTGGPSTHPDSGPYAGAAAPSVSGATAPIPPTIGPVAPIVPSGSTQLRRLAPSIVAVWTIGTAIFWGCVTLTFGLFTLASALSGNIPIAMLLTLAMAASALLGGFLSWWLPRARYRYWGYQLSPDGLVLQHGVLWRTHSVIPYVRIQHVDVGQGPVERRFGLSRLQVHTAAATTDSTIPGIRADEAESLRRALLARVGDDDAV